MHPNKQASMSQHSSRKKENKTLPCGIGDGGYWHSIKPIKKTSSVELMGSCGTAMA